MNPWPFVTAAYTLTLVVSAVIAAISYWAMRNAERGPK